MTSTCTAHSTRHAQRARTRHARIRSLLIQLESREHPGWGWGWVWVTLGSPWAGCRTHTHTHTQGRPVQGAVAQVRPTIPTSSLVGNWWWRLLSSPPPRAGQLWCSAVLRCAPLPPGQVRLGEVRGRGCSREYPSVAQADHFHSTLLHCTELHCTLLHSTPLHSPPLRSPALHYSCRLSSGTIPLSTGGGGAGRRGVGTVRRAEGPFDSALVPGRGAVRGSSLLAW